MRTVLAAIAIVGSLAVVPATAAGGWATVGLSALPTGVGPGEAWVVDLTILRHGETPLTGVRPKVTIANVKTGKRIEYPARPTAEAGVYRANVVFPASGEWDYEVNDGFSQVHTFAAVTIGESAPATPPVPQSAAKQAPTVPATESSSFPILLVAFALLLALATAGATRVLGRHRGKARAPAR
jgi:hypothetical protein